MAVKKVQISPAARKDLRRVPLHVARKLLTWVDAIEREGLEEVQKCRGYHDETLHGKRQGQRSIRLSRAYRAIYTVRFLDRVEFVNIEEVSKHDY